MSDEAKQAFDSLDAEGSGAISASELFNVLVKMGCSEEEAKTKAEHILKKCDKDEDSTISWEEFKTALMAGF